jgi:hypothetical protein
MLIPRKPIVENAIAKLLESYGFVRAEVESEDD